MGFLDNIEMANYDSPEMARAMAMLQMAGLISKPLAQGEGMGSRLIDTLGGGMTLYNKRMQELQAAKLDEMDAERKRKYSDLQTKKLETDIRDSDRKEQYINEFFGTGSPENLTEKDKLRMMIMTGMTPPGEVFSPKYETEIDGRKVPLTAAQLLAREKHEEDLEYRKNKKTVRSRGYGQEGVYDYEGNVKETRSVPVKPSTTKNPNKATNKTNVKSYMNSLWKEKGYAKRGKLTPVQEAAWQEIEANANYKAATGMTAEEAVQASLQEYESKRKASQPKPAATKGTSIKTERGTAKIID